MGGWCGRNNELRRCVFELPLKFPKLLFPEKTKYEAESKEQHLQHVMH